MHGFRFDPAARYRMPVLFGPSCGPRYGPEGKQFDYRHCVRSAAGVHFLTDEVKLKNLLPPGFELRGAPVVVLEHTILHNLPWLAGRSYSMLGMKIPVKFNGATEILNGMLLAVLWENRPEPILSGRDELGFSKVFCDLPEPQIVDNSRAYQASWEGKTFFSLKLTNLVDAPAPTAAVSDGVLHYAYMPDRSGSKPHEECTQVMLSPSGHGNMEVKQYQTGEADFQFNRTNFDELPTMYQIVNTLAELPIVETRQAYFMRATGSTDLSEQRVVEQA